MARSEQATTPAIPNPSTAPIASRKKASGVASGQPLPRRRGPFLIADGYLFRQVASATLSGLLRFAGLLLIVAAMTAVRQMATSSLSFRGMIELLALQMPRILLFTLPMSVLFGTVQTFADMSGRGEVIALWAGGMSLKRMMRAPLILGALIALFAFFIQEVLVPGAETRHYKVLATQLRSSLGRQENFSLREPARGPLRKVIQARHFDPETNVLTAPSIQIYRDLKPYLLITAARAEWNSQSSSWILLDGKAIRFANGRERSGFGKVSEFDRANARSKGYDLPNPDQMNAGAKSRTEHLENGDFEMISIADLNSYRAALQGQLQQAQGRNAREEKTGRTKLQKLISGATFGIHDKIATPLVCIFLVLVGAPIGIRPQRSSGGFSLGISLMVIMLYYVTWSALSPLGKNGGLNPFVAAYLAPLLTLVIGMVLVWKKNR